MYSQFLRLIFFSFSFALISCKQHSFKIFEIKGVLKHAKNNKVALLGINANLQPIILDTAILDNKGNFTLKTISNSQELFAVRTNDSICIWLINDVEKVEVNIDSKKYQNYQVKNSIQSLGLKEFILVTDSLLQSFNRRKLTLDTLEKSETEDSIINAKQIEFYEIEHQLKTYFKNQINDKSNSLIMSFFKIFYAIKTEILSKQFLKEKILDIAQKNPSNTNINFLKNQIINLEKNNQEAFLEDSKAPDFKLISQDSSIVSLSSFKNHFLLINFWNTSNKESLNINDKLKKYIKLKTNSQLKVLGINLDSNINTFKKYLLKDSLPWQNTRDTSYLESKLAKHYLVKKLPKLVMIDKNNRILETELNSHNLNALISFILKH